MAVSVGQAAANALAAWLKSTLAPDVVVAARWPSARDPALPAKAVTVVRVGRRQRLPVLGMHAVVSSVPSAAAQAVSTIAIGAFMQPMQIDLWAKTDIDRDDLVAQLDDAMTAGTSRTLPALGTSEPVRDGILVALLAADGYAGTVDCWFDEPETIDDPEAIGTSEYRATVLGEARGLFSRTLTTPVLVTPTLRQTGSF